MADIIDVEVVIRRNGRVMDGFPYVRRLLVNESQDLDVVKTGTDGASFVGIPGVNFIPTVRAFMLRTDTSAVNFSFSNGLSPFLQLNQGGFILAVDCVLSSSPTTNLLVNNNTTNSANIRGFVSGD